MVPPPPRPFRPSGSPEAVRVLATGLNLWAVAGVAPLVHQAAWSAGAAALAAAALVPLVLGAYFLVRNGSRARRDGAIVALLLVFPVLVALLASASELVGTRAPLFAFASALSVLAFGGVASEACSRPLALFPSTAQPLVLPRVHDSRGARPWMRRVILGGALLGSLAVAVLAPAMGSDESMRVVWGESVREGRVLAAVFGASACCVGIAGLLGPRLRAPRSSEVRPASRRERIAVFVLGLNAALGYLLLRYLETR
jgi:hypothetical protein